MRTLLFHREFHGYTGGHGKVFDYFRHAAAHDAWCPAIFFTQGAEHPQNPWRAGDVLPEARWWPGSADALFLAGLDWLQWPEDLAERPVINLIQHVRHADPSSDVHAFLERRAVRICVSQPVADAIAASGRVRGPVQVIDAALDLPDPAPEQHQRGGVLVAALKQPALGRELAAGLRAAGHTVHLLDAQLPRDAYLAAVAGARVAVCLPHRTEGFYLPALEAMALGCAVVVPDCIGNRAYVQHGRNALSSGWSVDALLADVERLRDDALCAALAGNGRAAAAHFSQVREREAFHRLLDDLPALWRESA